MDSLSTSQGAVASSRRLALVLPVYVGTIFLSAFLLFGIQPMFAKMVLPKLGGAPGVWSVAMVFYQAMLLAGYAYADWLVRRFDLRRAALIHIALCAAVLLLALPIGLAAGFDQPPPSGEIPWLVGLLLVSVGLPFFAVSANGPLLQAWFARSGHGQAVDPYSLYAASNAGSFLALVAYPFLIEPHLRLATQSMLWSWGFALLLAAIAACAGLALGHRQTVAAPSAEPADTISPRQKMVWAAYAFVPAGLLVAVTAHLSTDVAAAPLLWVVPLALFLLSFVLVFQRRPLLRHSWMLGAQIVLVLALLGAVLFRSKVGWGVELALHLAVFFATAMVAHGELAAIRPAARNLTQFYLWMSVGGVLGGLFSGLLAPLLFNSILEYPLLMIAGLLCQPRIRAISLQRPVRIGLIATMVLLSVGLIVAEQMRTDAVRSFFGLHRITTTPDGQYRLLVHGTTIHGAQRIRDEEGRPIEGRPEPLTYYFTGGAIADGIDSVRQAQGGRLGRVAAIGVGTGSLACQSRPGESWSFYEIDPHVIRIATDPALFSFFSACAPQTPFVVGDARLTLAGAADGSLDLIVIDAFSSDAIPTHLMTVEAMRLYLAKLSPSGSMLFHISNRNMELGPALAATAAQVGLTSWVADPQPSEADRKQWKVAQQVALVARRDADLGPLDPRWVRRTADPSVKPWQDDHADILAAIIAKWRQ